VRLPRMLLIGSRYEVARLVLFIAADENDETLAGCNDIALLKARIVHCAVCRFLFLLIRRWRNQVLRSRIGDKFLRTPASFLDALLPLFTR
jgi:hypothetical protein